MADKDTNKAAERSDEDAGTESAADRFQRTFGVSARDLAKDDDAMNRMVDLVEEADRLRTTNAAGTTANYDALRRGDQPAPAAQTVADDGTQATSGVTTTASVERGSNKS